MAKQDMDARQREPRPYWNYWGRPSTRTDAEREERYQGYLRPPCRISPRSKPTAISRGSTRPRNGGSCSCADTPGLNHPPASPAARWPKSGRHYQVVACHTTYRGEHRSMNIGDRVRIERNETRYPSKGTWPQFRGRTGTHRGDQPGRVRRRIRRNSQATAEWLRSHVRGGLVSAS